MAVSDGQGAAGVLPIAMGSTVVEVPVLPIAHAKAWKAHLWEALGDVKSAANVSAVAAAHLDPDSLGDVLQNDVRALDELTVDRSIELLVEFDRTGVLGGRERIENIASPRQVRRALEAMRDECFPFGDEMSFLQMLQVVVARSASPSSTNGLSPTGISPQDHLRKRSRTASSGSSGGRGRSA